MDYYTNFIQQEMKVERFELSTNLFGRYRSKRER